MDNAFFDVPDKLWARIEPVLPPEPRKPWGGRPRVPDRVALAGMLYRLRTGCQWKAIPQEFGSGSTCHLRLQQWGASRCVQEDSCRVAPLLPQEARPALGLVLARQRHGQGAQRGGDTGPNPTDRA